MEGKPQKPGLGKEGTLPQILNTINAKFSVIFNVKKKHFKYEIKLLEERMRSRLNCLMRTKMTKHVSIFLQSHRDQRV